MRSLISTSGAGARRRNVSRVAAMVSGACPRNRSAEPGHFGIECFLSYDRFQISDRKQRVGRWHLGEYFHPTHAQRDQSRRRLAAERQLPKVRAVGTPNRASEAAAILMQYKAPQAKQPYTVL